VRGANGLWAGAADVTLRPAVRRPQEPIARAVTGAVRWRITADGGRRWRARAHLRGAVEVEDEVSVGDQRDPAPHLPLSQLEPVPDGFVGAMPLTRSLLLLSWALCESHVVSTVIPEIPQPD
jgi:hypothetical protein